MSDNSGSLQQLLSHPDVRERMTDTERQTLEQQLNISAAESSSPFYIHLLAGLGAWFAAWNFLFFLGLFNVFKSSSGATVVGLLYLVSAIVCLRRSEGDFS